MKQCKKEGGSSSGLLEPPMKVQLGFPLFPRWLTPHGPIWHHDLTHRCQYFHPCAKATGCSKLDGSTLLEWIILDQRFSNGVPQEFLKHEISDYLVRDTHIFFLRLSNKKMATANTTTGVQCECPNVLSYTINT